MLNYCMALEKEGYRVTYLPVDREGLLKFADLEGGHYRRNGTRFADVGQQ